MEIIELLNNHHKSIFLVNLVLTTVLIVVIYLLIVKLERKDDDDETDDEDTINLQNNKVLLSLDGLLTPFADQIESISTLSPWLQLSSYNQCWYYLTSMIELERLINEQTISAIYIQCSDEQINYRISEVMVLLKKLDIADRPAIYRAPVLLTKLS